MSEKQISNEMADRLLDVTGFNSILIKQIKDIWSKNNLIEESDLEKARKEFSYLQNNIYSLADHLIWQRVTVFGGYYEKTISELEARIKELEEGKR